MMCLLSSIQHTGLVAFPVLEAIDTIAYVRLLTHIQRPCSLAVYLMHGRYLNHTPPPFRGAPGTDETEMVEISTMGWGGVEFDREFDADQPLVEETEELAPAYKDDVGFMSGVRRTRHVACFLMTVALYTLVVLYCTGISDWLSDNPQNFQVMLFAVFAVYAIEACGCSTSSLLWSIRSAPEANEYFYKMMDAVPFIKWTIRCYHLRRPVEPSAARPNDKVITYNRTSQHELQGCADETPLRFFTSHRLCLYTFAKSRRWRDAAAEERYEEEKVQLVSYPGLAYRPCLLFSLSVHYP